MKHNQCHIFCPVGDGAGQVRPQEGPRRARPPGTPGRRTPRRRARPQRRQRLARGGGLLPCLTFGPVLPIMKAIVLLERVRQGEYQGNCGKRLRGRRHGRWRSAWWRRGPGVRPPPRRPPVAPPRADSPPRRPKFVPRVAAASETEHGKTFAVLTINEAEAVTIRTVAGGFTPQQRAQVAVVALASLLQGGLTASESSPGPPSSRCGTWRRAGGRCCWRRRRRRTRTARMSPEELARSWVKALRRQISQPPLTLSPSGLIVPLGETRAVKVGGAALPADIQIGNDNANVSPAAFDPRTRLLVVQGRAAGRSQLSVQWAPGKGIGGPHPPRGGHALRRPGRALRDGAGDGKPRRARRPRHPGGLRRGDARPQPGSRRAGRAHVPPPVHRAADGGRADGGPVFPAPVRPQPAARHSHRRSERRQHDRRPPARPLRCCIPTARSRSSTARPSSRAISRQGRRRAWTTTTRTSAAGCLSSTWHCGTTRTGRPRCR